MGVLPGRGRRSACVRRFLARRPARRAARGCPPPAATPAPVARPAPSPRRRQSQSCRRGSEAEQTKLGSCQYRVKAKGQPCWRLARH